MTGQPSDWPPDHADAVKHVALIDGADAEAMAYDWLMVPMPRGDGRVGFDEFDGDDSETHWRRAQAQISQGPTSSMAAMT